MRRIRARCQRRRLKIRAMCLWEELGPMRKWPRQYCFWLRTDMSMARLLLLMEVYFSKFLAASGPRCTKNERDAIGIIMSVLALHVRFLSWKGVIVTWNLFKYK